MKALMASPVRRRGRPTQHLAAIWCPYAGLAPLVRPTMPSRMPRPPPHTPGALPLALSLCCTLQCRGTIAIVAERFVSFACLRPRAAPPLWESLSPSRAPPSSPPLSHPRLPRGEPHFPCFPSSSLWPSRPQLWRTSPLLHPYLLSSV